jgi:putative flippase GtrA
MSIVFSGILGAVINFSVNRHWAFASQGAVHSPLGNQLVRFIFVVAGSILLKSLGTHIITSFFSIDYRISRLMTDMMVSYGFNYTLLRYWVFKSHK